MTMSYPQYRAAAMETARDKVFEPVPMLVYTLGLVDEVIEVEDPLDRLRNDGSQHDPADRRHLVKELGDVTWYVAAIDYLLIEAPFFCGDANRDLEDLFHEQHDGRSTPWAYLRDMRRSAMRVGERTKKLFGHGHDMDHISYAQDLSQVLANTLALGETFGIKPHQIYEANIAKLAARFGGGKFSSEGSRNRKPGDE